MIYFFFTFGVATFIMIVCRGQIKVLIYKIDKRVKKTFLWKPSFGLVKSVDLKTWHGGLCSSCARGIIPEMMIPIRGVQDCVQLDRRPQWVDQELLVTVGGLGSSPGVAISLVEVRN